MSGKRRAGSGSRWVGVLRKLSEEMSMVFGAMCLAIKATYSPRDLNPSNRSFVACFGNACHVLLTIKSQIRLRHM